MTDLDKQILEDLTWALQAIQDMLPYAADADNGMSGSMEYSIESRVKKIRKEYDIKFVVTDDEELYE